ILSAWSVRAANGAVQAHEPERAVAILTDARQQLPSDGRIPSALALVHVNQHEYDRALDVYESWGMSGAKASDYRAAAGAAMAAHNNGRADQFLSEGLQQWANDVALLHMNAVQAISRGEYESARRSLKNALEAVKRQNTNDQASPTDVGQLKARPDVLT